MMIIMIMIMMIIIISTEVYFPLVFTIKPVYSLIALDVTGGHVGEKNNSKAINTFQNLGGYSKVNKNRLSVFNP